MKRAIQKIFTPILSRLVLNKHRFAKAILSSSTPDLKAQTVSMAKTKNSQHLSGCQTLHAIAMERLGSKEGDLSCNQAIINPFLVS